MTTYKAAQILRELVEAVNSALSVSVHLESGAIMYSTHDVMTYKDNLDAVMASCNQAIDRDIFSNDLAGALHAWAEVGKKFIDERWAKSCHEAAMLLFSSMGLSVVRYKIFESAPTMIVMKASDRTLFALKMPIPVWMLDWYSQTCVAVDVAAAFETKVSAEAGAAIQLIYAASRYMDIKEVLESKTPWTQLTLTDRDAVIEDEEVIRQLQNRYTIEDTRDVGKENCWYMMTAAIQHEKFRSKMFTDSCRRYFQCIKTTLPLFKSAPFCNEPMLLNNIQLFTTVSLVPDFRRGKTTYTFHAD